MADAVQHEQRVHASTDHLGTPIVIIDCLGNGPTCGTWRVGLGTYSTTLDLQLAWEAHTGPAEVQAIGPWRNNAELIRDGAVPLGYLHEDWRILDTTYRKGKFWTYWKPPGLVGTDLDPRFGWPEPGRSVDFRDLPFETGSFHATVCDPPYKLNGTPDSGGPADSDDSYGVAEAATRDERHDLMLAALPELNRVTVMGGKVLYKCQAQVNSGQVWWQPDMIARAAEKVGMRRVDMLHLRGGRDQPAGRSQQHARQNYSTLVVLEVVDRYHPGLF